MAGTSSVTAQEISSAPITSGPITSAPITGAPITTSVPVTLAPVATTTETPETPAPITTTSTPVTTSSPVVSTTEAPITVSPVMPPNTAPVAITSSPGTPVMFPIPTAPFATISSLAVLTSSPIVMKTDAPVDTTTTKASLMPPLNDAPIAPLVLVPTTPVSETSPGTPSANPSAGTASPSTGDSVLLPRDLQPREDFRCGISELDARGNCKRTCNDDVNACDAGEFCWRTFPNYCHIKPEGHPACDDLSMGDESVRRCGYEEVDNRSYCGQACTASAECGEAEFCYPVQRNFCDCFEMQDEQAAVADEGQVRRRAQERTNAAYFEAAKKAIEPYFVKSYVGTPPTDGAPAPPHSAPTNIPGESAGSSSHQSLLVGVLVAATVLAI